MKVLIVDDERDIVELLCALLETEGYSCLPAHNCAEATALVNEHKDIEAIFCDVRMPVTSGEKFLESIRKTKSYTGPFYFISAFHDLTEELASNLGASGIINKPFKLEEILSELESLKAA